MPSLKSYIPSPREKRGPKSLGQLEKCNRTKIVSPLFFFYWHFPCTYSWEHAHENSSHNSTCIYIYVYVHGTIENLSALFTVHVNRWVKSNISHELGRLLFLMCFKFGGLYCTLEDCTNLDITWSGGVNGRRNIITNYIISNPKGPQSSQRYQF